ncbi:MAG: hypothetical protein A2268_01895 [Candidatus Raymondbacteria bacterium RifOxyA12_full_50_37]|uniref:Phosphoglycerol geranylgeranyltransferase n=1 Tax=Candidatus Raymondbacteria bacterium RIFOXYD12_FULL_49_13 TaxID=1817890 RepID=A0A1F7F673_UNCRA|nr:MAG: hypothetical protein A2268_01895 [Candidatus Raymondbacteria bacterium RifOxyA12_full_50_37]OGJ92095.1 MAG: hypothetical protein A2248_10725 [Candidatus Raymondbacteria bacterium RIFOXYA2_FULL_49_16]OGJ98451.1 MAG: hypothetical protein A2453_06965 [Candidatus Raymondbacteria bacterium RIFOXYC2_FULL_50_21]OGK02006.1 MAG: hypothetical protein A2519_17490 [Candidatus Raymondbacteria bacterium RIFOXYD12_FULL_49_13]OGK06983.1 MAG: hypothetical protein A2487_08705 [Candidatus Raymondbacteria 
MSVKERLFRKSGASYVVLIDPEKLDQATGAETASRCSAAGVDALFVGGSTSDEAQFERVVTAIKSTSSIPVIIFPGNAHQIVRSADAVLFMSLLSGRNPRFLIEEQLKGVPRIREYGLETISMGYLLVASDKPSAVERVSQTTPIGRDDNDCALTHALAAQYFGMDAVYLEGGSGVGLPVPVEMVRHVRQGISIPLIVGGGIKSPDDAAERVAAGANVIVTGNVLEATGSARLLREFVQAVR